MTTDPMPSERQLRELYEARTGRKLDLLELPTFIRHGAAAEAAEPPEPPRAEWRCGHAPTLLWLSLPGAPRTKKNHGRAFGIKQSVAYVRYRSEIVRMVAELRRAMVLTLPLPDGRYNIAAHYFVDVHGEQADLCGLDQGLYDALEDAGVIANDWQFRTHDGTRIIVGAKHPRVELTITTIEDL